MATNPSIKSIYIPVTENDLEQLDAMKSRVGATSRAELIRNALRVYVWLHARQEEGYEFQLERDNEVTRVLSVAL